MLKTIKTLRKYRKQLNTHATKNFSHYFHAIYTTINVGIPRNPYAATTAKFCIRFINICILALIKY